MIKSKLFVNNKELIIIILILIITFSLLVFNLKNEALASLNNSINHNIEKIQVNFVIIFSKFISYIFETIYVLILTIIITTYLLVKNKKAEPLIISSIIFLSSISVWLFKKFLLIERPINSLILESDFSFPSGHSSIAVVLIGMFTYLYLRKNKTNKTLIASTSIILILLVALSRLILSVHWFSDVIGGLILGSIWLLIGILILRNYK